MKSESWKNLLLRFNHFLSEKKQFENDETQHRRRWLPPPPRRHHLHIFEITLLSVPKLNNNNKIFTQFHAQTEIKSETDRIRT